MKSSFTGDWGRKTSSGRLLCADRNGVETAPQQAETENPPTGGIFCFEPFLIRKALLAKETIEVLSPCFGWFALKKSTATEKTKKLQSNKRKNIGECKEKSFTCAAVSGIMFPSILT